MIYEFFKSISFQVSGYNWPSTKIVFFFRKIGNLSKWHFYCLIGLSYYRLVSFQLETYFRQNREEQLRWLAAAKLNFKLHYFFPLHRRRKKVEKPRKWLLKPETLRKPQEHTLVSHEKVVFLVVSGPENFCITLKKTWNLCTLSQCCEKVPHEAAIVCFRCILLLLHSTKMIISYGDIIWLNFLILGLHECDDCATYTTARLAVEHLSDVGVDRMFSSSAADFISPTCLQYMRCEMETMFYNNIVIRYRDDFRLCAWHANEKKISPETNHLV